MNNQEKQELNEKLARWVGNISHDWTDEVCGYKTTECFCQNCQRADDYIPFPCIPSFTNSLDACFAWLVPKLESWDCIINWAIEMTHAYADGRTLKEPALALCLVIEKLIEVKE